MAVREVSVRCLSPVAPLLPTSIECNLQGYPDRCAEIRRRSLQGFMAPTLFKTIIEEALMEGFKVMVKAWWVLTATSKCCHLDGAGFLNITTQGSSKHPIHSRVPSLQDHTCF